MIFSLGGISLTTRSFARLGSVMLGLVICLVALLIKPDVIPSEKLLSDFIIAVDAGHGGIDSGSLQGGIAEKEITLLLAEAVATEIQARNGTAIMTRDSDTDLWDLVSYQEEIEMTKQEFESDRQLNRPIDPRDRGIALGTRHPPTYRLGLRARLMIADQNNADLLISIHTNHFKAESAHGAVTLYQAHSPQSEQLAAAIQQYLHELLPGRSKPGIIADNFFILRRSKVPAVIVEVGFVSNKEDRELMMSEPGQKNIAQAIVNGIYDFFYQTDPTT